MRRLLLTLMAGGLWMLQPLPTYPGIRLGGVDSCALDTTGHSRTLRWVLGLAPAKDEMGTSAEENLLAYAEAIRAQYRAPAGITLPRWALVVPPASPFPGITGDQPGGGFMSAVAFVVREDGHVDPKKKVYIATASPEFNRSLYEAILRADSAGTLPPRGSDVAKHGGEVRLRLIDWEDRMGAAVALARLASSGIVADEGVEIISIPKPVIPQNVFGHGIEETEVELQYVVTEAGTTDPESIRVISAQYREFVASAITAVRKGRFRPARLGRCPLPMLVWQRVQFNLRPPQPEPSTN